MPRESCSSVVCTAAKPVAEEARTEEEVDEEEEDEGKDAAVEKEEEALKFAEALKWPPLAAPDVREKEGREVLLAADRVERDEYIETEPGRCA